MKYPGFVGPSYTSQSVNIDAQRTINLYIETDESGAGKSPRALIGTPGLVALGDALPTAPIRAMLSAGAPLSGASRLFVVAGSKLYEVDDTGAPINGTDGNLDRGDVGDDAAHSPAKLIPNGNQLGIVSAGYFYIDNGAGAVRATYTLGRGAVDTVNSGGTTLVTWVSGDVFGAGMVGGSFVLGGTGYSGGTAYTVSAYTDSTHIVLSTNAGTQTGVVYNAPTGDDVAASSGTFLDTYFIVSVPDTKIIQISDLNDGTKWNPLDTAVKEGYPDNIGAIISDHQELWLLGESTTEAWSDEGSATFPFVRDPGTVIPLGIAAPASVCQFADGVAWIGGDLRGTAIAYYARGFVPQRISTHAIETAWSAYSTIADAISWAQEWQGHQFLWYTFPTANATWVYDASEKAWHERGWWNGATIDRHRARCHAFCFGKHLVGDHTTGNIYEMSVTAYDDDGTLIHSVRSAPHISDEGKRIFFSLFRLDAENSGALNPSLDWSVDGGSSFGTARTTTSNTAGVFARYDYRRLGSSYDRVFRITITAAVKRAIVDAYIEFTQGNS